MKAITPIPTWKKIFYFSLLLIGINFIFLKEISGELEEMPAKYHNYQELTKMLQSIHRRWPNLTKLYKLSETTVEGRHLWVLQISTDVNKRRSGSLKPMVKYIGNIHGNEAVGRELLIQFAKYLLESYSSSSHSSSENVAAIRKLIETTDIHILPSMNPDGFEQSLKKDCNGVIGRPNAKGTDLNRNFPSQFRNGKIGKHIRMTNKEIIKLSPSDTSEQNNAFIQPETKAIMKWVLENPFVLSLILHGGAAGAFYPYDDGKKKPSSFDNTNLGYPSLTPDNEVMKFLANTYSSNHLDMHLGKPCRQMSFKDGIGNGAEWYPLSEV